MKRIIVLFVMIIAVSSNSHAQIEKGYWLTGGSASYNKSKSKVRPETDRLINMDINAGHFFIDKFAAGVRLGLVSEKSVVAITTKHSAYGGGPFIRYYFLPAGQMINFLVDSDVQFGWSTLNGKTQQGHEIKYSIGGGPVLFLNDVIGVEFLGRYVHIGYSTDNEKINNIHLSLGLQIYLTQ
jgi:hypothetical protein